MSHTESNDGTGFQHDLRGLCEGVATLRTDVHALARGTVHAAKSGASELRDGAQHVVESAQERLGSARALARGTFDSARESASDAAESLTGLVKRNPVACIGIAAGVGLLVALVLRNRRN